MWPNELVTGWCITERVKRLAGNEIELGIGYRRSNLGQVTYRWQREQSMLLCGLTDKDLHRICRNQYGHLGSAIGYWPRIVLGHVYIVLEPVGSARLTFGWRYSIIWVMYVGNRMLFWSPRWDHGHDEESRNGREVKIDIYDDGIRTPEVFRRVPGTYRVTGRGSGHPRQKIWALWAKRGNTPATRGWCTPRICGQGGEGKGGRAPTPCPIWAGGGACHLLALRPSLH